VPKQETKQETKQESTTGYHCNFCKKCVEQIKCQLCNMKNSACEIPYNEDNNPKLNRDLYYNQSNVLNILDSMNHT
jgi:hypothetical protein